MEKDCFFGVNWQSPDAAMPPEKNSGGAAADELPQPFLNLGWEQPMPHDAQLESALSSLVSSPSSNPPAGHDSVVIHELIGRLGSICNSGDISPSSRYCSANTSCYSTPLNSPPKLNLSMLDHPQQGRGGLPMPGSQMVAGQFAPFAADPGFVERAARFSCFGTKGYGGLGGQFGPPEAGNLSGVSSSQSLKTVGRPPAVAPANGKEAPLSDSGGRASGSTPDEMEVRNGQEASSASKRMTAGGAKNNASKRKAAPKGKGKEAPLSSAYTNPRKSAEEEHSNAKRSKPAEINGDDKDSAVKPKTEQNADAGQKPGKENNAKPPEPPKDYIHVRARRGQATDSHSLAERVRREKISERMKLLQDLVPGCNKLTGKAVMLDEIINYVQSLQRQVEFLSMKLATLNPRLGLQLQTLIPKDVYPLEVASRAFSYAQQLQGTPLQSVVTNDLDIHGSLNPFDSSLHRPSSMQLPPLDGFTDATSQLGNFWEDDLQYVVQMGSSSSSQNLHAE